MRGRRVVNSSSHNALLASNTSSIKRQAVLRQCAKTQSTSGCQRRASEAGTSWRRNGQLSTEFIRRSQFLFLTCSLQSIDNYNIARFNISFRFISLIIITAVELMIVQQVSLLQLLESWFQLSWWEYSKYLCFSCWSHDCSWVDASTASISASVAGVMIAVELVRVQQVSLLQLLGFSSLKVV